MTTSSSFSSYSFLPTNPPSSPAFSQTMQKEAPCFSPAVSSTSIKPLPEAFLPAKMRKSQCNPRIHSTSNQSPSPLGFFTDHNSVSSTMFHDSSHSSIMDETSHSSSSSSSATSTKMNIVALSTFSSSSISFASSSSIFDAFSAYSSSSLAEESSSSSFAIANTTHTNTTDLSLLAMPRLPAPFSDMASSDINHDSRSAWDDELSSFPSETAMTLFRSDSSAIYPIASSSSFTTNDSTNLDTSFSSNHTSNHFTNMPPSSSSSFACSSASALSIASENSTDLSSLLKPALSPLIEQILQENSLSHSTEDIRLNLTRGLLQVGYNSLFLSDNEKASFSLIFEKLRLQKINTTLEKERKELQAKIEELTNSQKTMLAEQEHLINEQRQLQELKKRLLQDLPNLEQQIANIKNSISQQKRSLPILEDQFSQGLQEEETETKQHIIEKAQHYANETSAEHANLFQESEALQKRIAELQAEQNILTEKLRKLS